MATQVQVPALGESVTQAILVKWHKQDGDTVRADEPLCELETDKANVDVPAPGAGVLRRTKTEGDTVAIGEVIGSIDEAGAAAPAKAVTSAAQQKTSDGATGVPAPTASSSAEADNASTPAPAARGSVAEQSHNYDDLSPAVRHAVAQHGLNPADIKGTGPGGRITKEDVSNHVSRASAPAAAAPQPPAPTLAPAPAPSKDRLPANNKPAAASEKAGSMSFDANGIHRAPMSKIRKRIAENLLRAQSTAAILTTFNEVDLTEIMDLRARYKERFQEVHGIGLGMMSFFARAAVLALKEFPRVNAFIEGEDVVYHNYVHLGIAVSTERGLAVPVLRNVQDMSFARIESEIKRLATATRDGKLGLEELSGGTFTITNGGVFGSLLSTPILNPPQSGILGMHTIQKRPVAVGDKVEIRPMMYVALSYDHRIVDGRESVSFLVRLKQYLEDPARLMLEI